MEGVAFFIPEKANQHQIKRKIEKYYKQLYANTSNNLYEQSLWKIQLIKMIDSWHKMNYPTGTAFYTPGSKPSSLSYMPLLNLSSWNI